MILKKAKSEKVIFVSLPQLKSKPMLPIFGAKTNTDSNFEFYVLQVFFIFGAKTNTDSNFEFYVLQVFFWPLNTVAQK